MTCEKPVSCSALNYLVRPVYLQRLKLILLKFLCFVSDTIQNVKYGNNSKRRERGGGLRFLCTVLLLSEIYLPTQFQVDNFNSSQIMS